MAVVKARRIIRDAQRFVSRLFEPLVEKAVQYSCPVSAARCVPSTNSVPIRIPVNVRNRSAKTAARRKPSDLKILGRRTNADVSMGQRGQNEQIQQCG